MKYECTEVSDRQADPAGNTLVLQLLTLLRYMSIMMTGVTLKCKYITEVLLQVRFSSTAQPVK